MDMETILSIAQIKIAPSRLEENLSKVEGLIAETVEMLFPTTINMNQVNEIRSQMRVNYDRKPVLYDLGGLK